MTDQEAIKYIKDANRNNQMVGILPKSDIGKCLINALEESQHYRELERRLNGIDLTMLANHFMEIAAEGEIQGYQRGRVLTNEDADKWDAYLAIGTPDECRAAVEKQKAKKPNYDDYHRAGYRCQTCNNVNPWGYKHCKHCGQKLDWEGGGVDE